MENVQHTSYVYPPCHILLFWPDIYKWQLKWCTVP